MVLGSGAHSASMAYVANRTSSKDQVLAVMGSAFAISGIVGPGLASAAVMLGPLVPYFLFGFITALIALLIFIFLPEKTKPTSLLNSRNKLTPYDTRVITFALMGFVLVKHQLLLCKFIIISTR